MSVNTAIDSIVSSLSTQFGAEEASENKVFQDAIRNVCLNELNKLNLVPKDTQPKVAAVVAQPLLKKRNGYNLYVSDLRVNLVAECGSEEAATAEFKARGGITGAWVKEQWAALSEPEQTAWNAKAKAEREGSAPAPTAVGGVNKRATSPWQLFQKAFSAEIKDKKAAGEEVPVFKDIGERSKACSDAYKLLKDKPKELAEYLAKHTK